MLAYYYCDAYKVYRGLLPLNPWEYGDYFLSDQNNEMRRCNHSMNIREEDLNPIRTTCQLVKIHMCDLTQVNEADVEVTKFRFC